jgi:hypothetical protein
MNEELINWWLYKKEVQSRDFKMGNNIAGIRNRALVFSIDLLGQQR